MRSAKLRAGLLSALPALDERTLKDLEALASQAEVIEVRRGGILIRQGEPSDVLYFVLSGRFSVHSDGAGEPIAEIAQGRRQILTSDPADKSDRDVMEVIIDLESKPEYLPIGLRVSVIFLE